MSCAERPRISPTTSGSTVSCPCPEDPASTCSTALPVLPKRITASSFGAAPAPEGSQNTAQPMPRSFPFFMESFLRDSKLSQSDFSSACSNSPAGSPLSYRDPTGVLYGNASFGMKLIRRSSVRSMPVSRAASSTRRSTRYETFGRPAPR
jgi:hypothetical protein